MPLLASKRLDFVPVFPARPLESGIYPFMIKEGCLGVPTKVVPAILRSAWRWVLEHSGIESGSQVRDVATNQQVCTLTRCILALNPDHHSAWNWRKRLLRDGVCTHEDEMRMLDLFVTYKRHCKASLVWHHRRWILETFVFSSLSRESVPETSRRLATLWKAESALCYECCERYPRNYHCWVYRWWCYQQVRRLIDTSTADTEQHTHERHPDDAELESVSEWVGRHPADYAALHYHHLLAEFVCQDPFDVQRLTAIAQTELASTTSMLAGLYTSYESIWYHRRWCLSAIASHTAQPAADKEMAFAQGILDRFKADDLIAVLVEKHKAWVCAELLPPAKGHQESDEQAPR
ncbi:hypothetical protein GQ54DRAFT_297502 [Martensiomyces pterosporus]|nr:hypothetical protein GQ54DRAFT_297502 [Martensiomyces pterosporus]